MNRYERLAVMFIIIAIFMVYASKRWPKVMSYIQKMSGYVVKSQSVLSERGWAWNLLVTIVQVSMYVTAAFVIFDLTEIVFRLVEIGLLKIFSHFDLPKAAISDSWIFSITFTGYMTLRFIAYSYKWFTGMVPEFMALITVNQFTGELRKYRTGSFRKMPWEVAKPSMYFLLELITIECEVNCPTKNGGVAAITLATSYKPDFDHLDTYAQVDEVTIGTGLIDGAKAITTQKIGQTRTDMVTDTLSIIRTEVDAKYGSQHVDDLEKKFGIEFEIMNVAGVEFSKKTQETLDTAFATETLLKGHENNPAMRNDILALQTGGKVNKEVMEIKAEGFDNLGPIAGMLLPLLPTAVQSAFRKAQNKGGKGQGPNPQPNTP